jgi:hypothetical protein
MRKMRVALCLVSVLVAMPALGEDVTPAAAEAPKPEAPAVVEGEHGSMEAPAKPEGPASSDAALAVRLESVERQAQELDKARADTKAALDKAGKLKVSGYLQARYEWHQDSVNGWDYTAKPTTSTPPGNAGTGSKTTFYVRRARVTTGYKGTNMEYLLQLEAAGDAATLKDAEAVFVDTWTPLHLRVSVGQFKYTFGYELQQSDTVREMPERSRMVQQLFAGERDRGLKVQGSYQWLRFQVALVNGNGVQDPVFKGGKDENSWKDVVGRVGFDLTSLVGGVSGYYGANDVYNPSYNATTNPDTNPLDLKRYQRTRVGADVQGYLDVPSLGALSLRGEVIYSRDKNKDYNGVLANSCQDRIGWGWSLIAAQNLGNYLGAVVRVDGYDPLLQGSFDSAKCSGTSSYVAAGKDRVLTYGGGLMLFVSSNLKATLSYEHPTEQADKKVDNDLFTMQLQAKF